MRFPSAQKGVSKLFAAQILLIIAAACGIVGGIGIFTEPTLTVIFGVATVILMIIAYILEIIGVAQAQRDDDYFKAALVCTIIGIVIAVISGIFQLNATASSILTFISTIANILVTIFIIMGIRSVSEKLGDDDLARKANRQLYLIAINYAIGIVIQFIGSIMGATESFFIVAGILSIAGNVIQIVTFILFLILLNKARHSFRQ